MYTYLYSIKSRSKVLHVDGCHHLRYTAVHEIGKKCSLGKALSKGFTLCKHCMTVQNRFAMRYIRCYDSYGKHNYTYTCGKDYLDIITGKGSWRVIYAQNNPVLELYHQNKEARATDVSSRIPGYHFQHVREYEFDEIFTYIRQHDGKVSLPPPKSSKRYKAFQKKIKQQQRREAIDNVNRLIDSLHFV